MATRTETVRSRVEADVKKQAESVLARLGLTSSMIVNLLYKQIALHGEVPFAVRVPTPDSARDYPVSKNVPNAATRMAIRDAEEGRNLKEWDDIEAMHAAAVNMTAGDYAAALLLEYNPDAPIDRTGYSYGEVIAILKEEYPECKTTINSLRYRASRLRREGWDVPRRPRTFSQAAQSESVSAGFSETVK